MTETKLFDYIEEAHVTASDKFYGEAVALSYFVDVASEFVEAGEKLDNLKKGLFYGKFPGGVPGGEFVNMHNLANVRMGVSVNLIHGIIGVATEAAELLEALVKVAHGQPLDLANVGEECGDIFWYLALIAKACGMNFGEMQHVNIAKLRARYGEKFSEYDANNRDLIEEREILERVQPCLIHEVSEGIKRTNAAVYADVYHAASAEDRATLDEIFSKYAKVNA